MGLLNKLINLQLSSVKSVKIELLIHGIVAIIYFSICFYSPPIVAGFVGFVLYIWQRILTYRLKQHVI